MLRQLRVAAAVDMRTGTVSGFYIDQKNLYDINFSTGVARVGNEVYRFDSSSYIRGELDFYVLPSFFKKVFDLDFNVDFNSLSLVLTTSQELPVVKDFRRQTTRHYMVVSPGANLEQAPLLFPRQRYMLNGGVLDYSLSAFNTGGPTTYGYSFDAGGEVLGGETQGSLVGGVSGGNPDVYSSTLSWKYAFDSSAYITYAGLGNLYSTGLTTYGFRGAQVSNEPLTVRTVFGQYLVNARTNPNWDVELYLNGQLVGYKRADAQGRAEFSIPLVYGTSYLQIKYYGPNGQFREDDRRLQIPFTFVPSGQVNYTVSAGKVNNTDYNFLSANTMIGLSDWATDKIGVDYLDSPLYSRPLLYNSIYLRFGPQYMMSLDAAPDAFYRSTFSALYASQAAFDLKYAHYEKNLLYNPSYKLQEMQGDAYLPVFLGRNAFNFRVAGSAQSYYGGQTAYSYSANFSSSFSQLNLALGYVRSIIDYGAGPQANSYDITGSLLYSMFFQQGSFDFLNGTLVSVSTRYGVLKNSLDDISIQLSKNIQRYVRIGFSADRNFVNRSTSFSLQIIADLPFTRSTSSAQFQGRTAFYSQNVSGSVGFDSNYGKFLFNDLGWVGRSAASVRMFVDANGNGRYDKGEEVIRDGKATLRQAVSSETSNDGITRDWNMLPYTRYSADVDLSTIRNPLWIPEEQSFSFVTDPNTYKEIDVPFFVGGIVGGTILRESHGKLSAVAGLSLKISSADGKLKKTVPVFNDGSFYYMGLPPGEYEARVDSTQLSILGVYEEPEVLRFTIKPTKDGDYVEGLKIILKARKPEVKRKSEGPAEGSLMRHREKYVVQIGAFKHFDLAKRLARATRILTGQLLVERYSQKSGLFVVQTDTFETKRTALDRLDVFINKFGFFDAFVNSTVENERGYIFRVELASFRSLYYARRFASKVREETELAPEILFRRSSNRFSVMVGPYKSEDAAEKALSAIRKRHSYRHALVIIDGESGLPRRFTVTLGKFRSEGEAREFASLFRFRTGQLALVGFDCRKLEFRVFTPALKSGKQAWALLGKIKEYDGYSAAKLISLP